MPESLIWQFHLQKHLLRHICQHQGQHMVYILLSSTVSTDIDKIIQISQFVDWEGGEAESDSKNILTWTQYIFFHCISLFLVLFFFIFCKMSIPN